MTASDIEQFVNDAHAMAEELTKARDLARQWFWDVISIQYGGTEEILEEFQWLKERGAWWKKRLP